MILVKKCKFCPNLILRQIVKNLLLIRKGLDMTFDDVVTADKKLRNCEISFQFSYLFKKA